MKPSTYLLTLVTTAVLVFASNPASAQNLNVNLGGGDYGTVLLPYTGPAVIGGAKDQWNNYDLTAQGQSVSLVDSGGNTTDATLDFTAYSAYVTADARDGFLGTSYAPLMTSYLNTYGETLAQGGNPQTVTLDGLSEGTYNLFIYSQSNELSDTNFTLNGSTLEANNPHDLDGGTSPSTFIEGVNYVEFQNVAVDSTGNLQFSWIAASANTPGAILNGFQLETVEAPEPSTWAMMLAGLGALLFQVRRRRA